ncbi:hypothetical protein [uncultured Sphingomonas sp.]|uniref:hypothetical protein n=1 Tax=uncultured Sphingomonas sp. TaxID=158754 RepID=UPI002591F063|nr:hypothetical protein [uncultured Sphingomonas sp.]
MTSISKPSGFLRLKRPPHPKPTFRVNASHSSGGDRPRSPPASARSAGLAYALAVEARRDEDARRAIVTDYLALLDRW